jgi:hypothetical protein
MRNLVTAGVCFALILFMKNCLDKAIEGIPACDQVTGLNECAELTTHNTLVVIFRFLSTQVELALPQLVVWKQLK